MTEIIGVDHVYIAVSDLRLSERYYDHVMLNLGFRKNGFSIDGDEHIQYYNRHFGFVLRPARSGERHDPYAPGLHHFCLRVDSEDELSTIVGTLRSNGVEVSGPHRYPQYAADYVAIFLSDPDGIRLEVTNYRQERRRRHDHWDEPAG